MKNISTNTIPTKDDWNRSLQIYDSLKEELEKTSNGKYISIDPDSGRYFIGNTREESVKKAKKETEEKIVFVRRIGILDRVSYIY